MNLRKEYYINQIKFALSEDLQDAGDVTSEAIFDNEKTFYNLIAKDDGVLCGVEVFKSVFKEVDAESEVVFNFSDSSFLKKGNIVAKVEGRTKSLLTAERTALNFISHLSGIATKVRKFADAASGMIEILDTRKTIPGLRYLQKYAVFCGGGQNHRMGLFDMVMIKDNHIDASGSIGEAVSRVKKRWGNKFKIEVETRNLEEVKMALCSDVDVIMLDNMDNNTVKEALSIINDQVKTEISGNITIERIDEIKEFGLDYVSIGELTHTVKAFDFSLKRN